METRNTSDSAFCWQSKAARRAIRDAFDATSNVATALCVYDALTEIASDDQSETFTTTHAWISRLSGVSPTTIKKVLPELRELGLVSISTPALRAPSTYTLHAAVSVSRSTPNDRQQATNVSRSATSVRQRKLLPPVATSEESQKNLRIMGGKKAPPPPDSSRPAVPDTDTKALTIASLRAEWPDLDIDKELKAALRHKHKIDASVQTIDLSWFAQHWLPKCGPTIDPWHRRSKPALADMPEPEAWRETLEAAFPENLINRDQKPWTAVPNETRAQLWPEQSANGRHHAAA